MPSRLHLFLPLSFCLMTALSVAQTAPAASMAPLPTPQRVFVSGHSLIDNPLPTYLAEIARSLGHPMQWNQQNLGGSAIEYRTRGRDRTTGWAGYSAGDNRAGKDMNVIREFLKPATTDGKPYDTLVITEQHGVLDSIVFRDSLRYLRHYHDRFIDGNARGQTWFYEPWMGLIDKSDPTRWIAYERAAAPMWQCIVSRVNLSLAAEGRADRIKVLPVSLALVGLVERVVRGEIPGLRANSTAMSMDRIFQDKVHLTPLGAYYIALSTYAVISGKPPTGAWAPDGVNARLASALQRAAWETTSAELAARKALPVDQCTSYLKGFRTTYFDHMRDYYWAEKGKSPIVAYRRFKQNLTWRWKLRSDFDNDPFKYDPATDRQHWLPAP